MQLVSEAATGLQRRRWLMLGVALLAQVSVAMLTQGVPTLAPFIQADLGLTRGQVGLVGSALMAGSLVALAAAGWVVDVYGERLALTVGNLVSGLLIMVVAATSHFHTALFWLFFSGIGAAATTPGGSKTVMLWFPPAQRGTAMGIRQTAIPVGGALAAAVLPALAISLGWRAAVAASGIGCLLVAALCWIVYRRPEVGETEEPTTEAAGGGWLHLLSRDVLLAGLAGALLPMGQFCLVAFLALFLKETHGVPISVSAGLLVAAQVTGAVARVIWGTWSDRFFGRRRRPPLFVANVLAAAGALALGWVPQGLPLWPLFLLVVAYAFCTIGWHGNWVALLAELAGPEQQGRTIGLGMTIMYVGIMAGPPLFGALVDRAGDWRLAWSLLALVLAVGAFLVLAVRERPQQG